MTPRRLEIPSVKPGSRIVFRSEKPEPNLLIIDYGPYGTIEATISVNREVALVIGNRAPEISIYDGEVAPFDGGNIVSIEDDE